MAKVYRLHEGQDGTGWFSSNPITNEQLKTIKTSGTDVATSIPSPFARIDLVKSAFQWVAENGIDGKKAQHKLVSDALDVAQLFFSYQKYKSKIKIVSWNPKDRFRDLKESKDSIHAVFAHTLDVYWQQDGSVYNFDKVNRLYFILNSTTNHVIGGTSPATLFFAAPDVNEVTENLEITSGSDVLFDDNYTSLDKRDKSFIQYMFTISKQPNFANLFPDVYAYLKEVGRKLDDELKAKITNIIASDIDNYVACPVLENKMNPCEVLGIKIGMQPVNGDEIEKQSDFIIKPEIQVVGQKPMVLPNDKFSNLWTYTRIGVLWDPNNRIPLRNTHSPSNSVLPIQNDHYYWLSIGDFLEDKIIELPYTIDNTKFKTCGSKKHLLPLTPLFFKYFKAENVSNHLKIDDLAGGGIEVKLEIPVKRGSITFKKTYHREDIVKLELHLAILPFFRSKAIELDYTIGLQDVRYNKVQEIIIESYENGTQYILCNPVIRRPEESGSLIKSIYYKSKEFDSLRIGNNELSGFIVPIMKVYSSNQQVSFAIDFGTTNTHIEYKNGANVENALDSIPNAPIWQSLLDTNAKNLPEQIRSNSEFEREIIPYQFNEESNYKFPFRTALIYNNEINFDQPLEVFRHVNNYFLLEKVFYTQSVKLHTKLKWGNYNNPEDKKLVESYIDYLMHIVLYKTLLLNGNPETTKITWFYPVSMDSFELGIFTQTWKNSYQRIFKNKNVDNINAIPESIAPYLHYRSQYPGLSLSIDIGGGSSDIAVFQNANDLPEFISSFKFAGNALFGDGFSDSAFSNNSDLNGYVNSFKGIAIRAIDAMTASNAGNIKEIFADIVDKRKNSADFSSFLFSLESEGGIDFKYANLLRQDKKLKLPILIFYAAVIYYSANLLKKFGVNEIPKNILLSGTAAKTIKIIDSQDKSPNASKLFKYIFEQVMGLETNKLNVALSDNPKEITCKGVLKTGVNVNIANCPMVFWLGGNNDSIWNEALNKNEDIQRMPFYKDLDDNNNKILIENSINVFYELLDSYLRNINIDGEFGIDNIAYLKFKEIRSLNIKDFLDQGLKAFYKSPEKHIEETLFFYPLIGILNKLAYELSNIEAK